MITERTDLFLGRLVKPFGIKGEVKLYPSDDFWDGVLESGELQLVADTDGNLSRRRLAIERFRRHGKFYLVKFEGVDDRNGAESLVNTELFLPLDKIDVALPDRIMPFQIIGCKARTEDGAGIGTITDILFTPAHPIYEITGESNVSLVPAVPEFITGVDLDAGEVVVRPIPGLLDGT